jgi:CheY-like chemotaxis protein
VVLADPDPERAKVIAAVLSAAGLEVILAHDGVEAILTIQRVLPRAVILNASLPKMFGFQICELMKRNESLRDIGVLLVGSVHRAERYRRPPTELYGADAYLEEPDVAEAALVELRHMGLSVVTPPSRTSEPAPPPPQIPTPVAPARPELQTAKPVVPARPTPQTAKPVVPARPAPQTAKPVVPARPTPQTAKPAELTQPAPQVENHGSPPPAASGDTVSSQESGAGADLEGGVDEAIAKAERLARIIVSDIVLYNDEKFAAAVAAGNVVEALEGELEEGRALFRGRIEPGVRETRDFLSEELLRVARTRGAK